MNTGSIPPPRFALLGALALLTILAAVRLATTMNDPADFLLALGLVALFTPLKALMIRWLGGRRPYQSAFASSLFSAIVGMVFREPLNLWALLFRSTHRPPAAPLPYREHPWEQLPDAGASALAAGRLRTAA